MNNINDKGKIKQPSFARLWFKKAFKNIAVGAVSLGVVAGAMFGFAGCGHTDKPGPTPPPPVDPNPPIVTPQPDDKTFKNVDFSEFLEKYNSEGVTFFNNYLKSIITDGKDDIVAETVNFDATQDDSALDHVSYAFIYKTGETTRKYDIVNVMFSSPIKFDDILNKEVADTDIVPISQTVLSFDFDAKENVEKSDLIDALSSRIGKFTTINSSAHKYLTTVEHGANSLGAPTLTYKVLFEDNNKFFVDSIKVYDEGYDDATLIENLLDDAKFNNMRWGEGFGEEVKLGKLQGETIYKSEYKPEYQKEEPGPEIPGTGIEDVEDLVTNYSTELNQGLQGAYDHIVEKVLPSQMDGSRFSADKLSDTQWNLETDANGSISKVNYYGTYDNRIFFVTSVDLESPLNIKDLTDKNIVSELQKAINGATYNQEVTFTYNQDLQSQYNALAAKIFEKEELKEEGATYYIGTIEGGTDQTLGSVRDTTVLQVTNNGVKQISVRIQSGTNLVQNVNSGLYKKTEEKSYDFGDYTFNAETNKVATTSLSLYNEKTGKYNIEDFGDEILF